MSPWLAAGLFGSACAVFGYVFGSGRAQDDERFQWLSALRRLRTLRTERDDFREGVDDLVAAVDRLGWPED